MSRLKDHRKQHLKVRDAQLELDTDNYVGQSPLTNDVAEEIEVAKIRLEKLEAERIKIEHQRAELSQISELKEEFLNGQREIEEKLTVALTAIDRGISSTRQEMEDLEQTRVTFAEHLSKLSSLDPESWKQDRLKSELERAISAIQFADDEYENAVTLLSERQPASISSSPAISSGNERRSSNNFKAQFLSGLAFNLPLILFGALALCVYLIS